VLTGGRVVVEDGEVKVAKGVGKFVPTPPFSPYVYDKVKAAEAAQDRKWVPVYRSEQDMYVNMDGPKPILEGEEKAGNMHETSFNLDQHTEAKIDEEREKKPTIDSKPQIRVRAPPGGRSSIGNFF